MEDRGGAWGCAGELLAGLAIVGLCVGGAVAYGIVHDQVTIRICLEYFTVFHPPVFATRDPTLLALGWGFLATWWAGALIGVPLAVAARAGAAPKRSARELVRPVAALLAAMAVVAVLAGILGRTLASTGAVVVAGPMVEAIPRERHVDFLTDLWIHNGSYWGGFVGGIVLAIRTWRGRRRGWNPPAGSGGPVGGIQGTVALALGLLVAGAGLLQTGMDEEFLPRFHFPLLNVAFGAAAGVLGILSLAARGRTPRAAPLLRNAGAVAALFLTGALVVQGCAEGVVAERRFDMTWSAGTYRSGDRERTRVLLEFADHPGWTTEIPSQELADHLAAAGSPRVPVVIRTVRDFGLLREFKVVRVADREEWTYNDHSGWTGNCGWRTGLEALRDGLGPPPIR